MNEWVEKNELLNGWMIKNIQENTCIKFEKKNLQTTSNTTNR